MFRKISRKSQQNFQDYVKKMEAQAKKWFSYKKKKTKKKRVVWVMLAVSSSQVLA